MQDNTIKLHDGRNLGFAEYGKLRRYSIVSLSWHTGIQGF